MSHDSRSERERLKEEYKEHYRKMRETKERLARAQKTKNISDALKNMDRSELMNSFDNFLFSVKEKIATVEARLDLAMNSLPAEAEEQTAEQEQDDEMRRANARETLRRVKMEMGVLYNEIERQADLVRVEKTIGNRTPDGETGPPAKEPRQEQK